MNPIEVLDPRFADVARGATPLERLATELIAIMRLPDVEKRMAGIGSGLVGSRPEVFRAWLEREIATWAEAVKASGATVD